MKIHDKIFSVLKEIILQLLGAILMFIITIAGIILLVLGLILVIVVLKHIFLFFKIYIF